MLVGRTYTVADLRLLMAEFDAAIDAGEKPAPVMAVWRLFGEMAHAIAAGEQRYCMGCDARFHVGFLPQAIGVVQADVAHPSGRLVFGICQHCRPCSAEVWTAFQLRMDAHASGHIRPISAVVGHA